MDWLTSLEFLELGQFAPRWMLLLLDGALKATLILMVAGVVTLAMRSASAAARHAVWAMALGSVLGLPMLATLLPKWELGLIPVSKTWVSEAANPPRPDVVMIAPPAASEIPTSVGKTSAATPAPILIIPESPVVPKGPAVRRVEAAPPGVASRRPEESKSLFVMIASVWTLGMLAVFATLLGALYKVHRLEGNAVPVTDARWLRLVDSIRQRIGITRPVGLLRSTSVGTPATWGVARPVVMIPANADEWSADRKQDVLVHELAHVKRYDFLTQMIGRYACAIFWFHPLVWLAARQMRVERERACDDEVLASGTKASSYAGHLLEIARSIKGHSAANLAAVSMAHRSQLTGRLLAVLEEGRNRSALSRRGSVVLWLCGLALLLPIVSVTAVEANPIAVASAPAATPLVIAVPDRIIATPEQARPTVSVPRASQRAQWVSAPRCREALPGSDSRGTNSNSNNDRHTIRWWDGDCEGELRMRGDVRFTSDFRDVASVARDGRFSLEINADGDARRIEITRDGQSLARSWFVNGREQPYDGQAEQWFAAALQDLFRHSSIAMTERVDYILASSGVQGLVDQAGLSHGSYLTVRYYSAAIETGQLQTTDINQILQRAIDEVSSDFEMARLLMTIPPNQLQDPTLRRTYVQASNTISSDFEKRRVLSTLLQQPELDPGVVEMLLGAAQDLQSDFELASLLTDVGPMYLANPTSRDLFLQAAQTIHSDFELRRTLTALLQRDDLSRENLRLLLQAATGISSDFESASLLIEVAQRFVVDDTLRDLFFQSVDGISSDFEKRRVLNALLRSDNLNVSLIPAILTSGSTINSDFELAELLTDLVGEHELTTATRPVFFRALETIQSDFEMQRVLVTLTSRDNLPVDLVNAAIRSTASINSDFSKAAVLTGIAARYRTNEAIRTALENAADSITSDFEYGRVMAAIRGRTRSNND